MTKQKQAPKEWAEKYRQTLKVNRDNYNKQEAKQKAQKVGENIVIIYTIMFVIIETVILIIK